MQKLKSLVLSFCAPCNYLAAIAWAILITFHFVSFDTYVWLATEDRLGENMTSVFYFVAAVLLVLGSIRDLKTGSRSLPRQTLPLLLALFFVFIAGVFEDHDITSIRLPQFVGELVDQDELAIVEIGFHRGTFDVVVLNSLANHKEDHQ